MVVDCCSGALWMVIVGFIIAFVLAFGIGANDVANSFGTSVGSKVLTLKQACILATIFEILGAILIGSKVSGTIRKGILDPAVFTGSEQELMLGYVSALAGCCIWLIAATVLNLPVSGTHSIVGATIGMALVSRGFTVIKWMEILKIVLSWFVSPLLSGIVSLLMFLFIRKFILRSKNPLASGLRLLPAIYTITIVVNIGGILEASPPLLKFHLIPWWGKLLIAIGIAVIVYLTVWLGLVPRMRRKITKTLNAKQAKQDEIELEEAAKLTAYANNGDETANDNDNKHNISTQVDHIQLIMSKANIDYPPPQPLSQSLDNTAQQALDNLEKKRFENFDKFDTQQQDDDDDNNNNKSHPNSSHTIHGTTNISHYKDKFKASHKRKRLDSAPVQEKNDSDYNDDVNLTLSGYLHTIHSQSLKQHFSHIKQHQHSRTYKNSSSSNDANNKLPLTKLFQHNNNATTEETTNLEQTENNLKTSDKALSIEYKSGSKKVGRFVREPANFNNDVEQQSKIDILKTSVPEIDAEVEQNINELPEIIKEPIVAKTQKFLNIFKRNKKIKFIDEKKKPEPDTFANIDPPEAAKLFSFLQVLTAIFGSFAHGGNDVSNAIGPLIGLYLIYQEGKILDRADTPEWILFYGGVGISVGLWILGRRVIKTIGEDLTKITPSSGFVIELASAMTVLVASLLNIPVSTTHCKVGSVVFTGRVRAKQSVDWSLFRNIIVAWIVTVPVTGGIAAACQAILKAIFVK